MDSHTISTLNRLEVVDTGRRRRWSEEEKARIVLESLSEPRLVAATARRYGLSRSLLVTWRRAFAATGTKSEAGFVRAVVAEGCPRRRWRRHRRARPYIRRSVGSRSS
ncbi:transposase [Bradyrhizobium sp. STM 3561]|uniref:transposase n=1 Tax=unclassified Bradyrhizobium TaxID=2631580 RepID=UPI003890FED6